MGQAVRTHALVSEQSWQAMTSPVRLKSGATYPYGFGWSCEQWSGQAILLHDGTWQGFTSCFERRVGADGLAVAVFVNRDQTNLRRLAREVMALYEPDLALSTAPVEDQEPEVTCKVHDLLTRAAAKKVDEADFAYLRGGYNARFVDGLADAVAPLGVLQALRLLGRRELGDDREYRYEAQGAQALADVVVQLTAAGKVSRVTVRRR